MALVCHDEACITFNQNIIGGEKVSSVLPVNGQVTHCIVRD